MASLCASCESLFTADDGSNRFPSGMTTNQIDDGNKSKIETTDPRVKGTFTGRAGTEEDMAQLCLSLAVNNFVTGEVIGIDGGSQMISP